MTDRSLVDKVLRLCPQPCINLITLYVERGIVYLEKNPFAEPPYWGVICMLGTCTVPCWLLTAIALVVALIMGHPWNWITGGFAGAALLYSFAAVIVWREDVATLKKNGWYDL